MNTNGQDHINFYDRYYHQPKNGKDNYHAYSDTETFNIIKKNMDFFGITRVANITGLDRLGIPVMNAIRPNLNEWTVSHGKGLTLHGAANSALMESIERYHGVNPNLESFEGTYNEISKKYKTIKYDDLALSKNSFFHPDFKVKWTLGWDIMNNEEVAVPLGLVSLYTPNEIFDDFKLFQSSSNGLAGGIDFLEAVLQALFEVIERDAVTCHQLAAKAAGSPKYPLNRLDLETVTSKKIIPLLETLENSNIHVDIFDCTIDTEMPTFNCFLLDKEQSGFDLCHGMGSSLSAEVALSRAITEAVQARAVFQSGVRESFFHDVFLLSRKYNPIDLIETLEYDMIKTYPFDDKNEGQEDYALDIKLCLEKLQKIGTDQVIVFDITHPEVSDLCAVKVVVPGLEGYMLPYYTPGKRGLEFLNKKRGV